MTKKLEPINVSMFGVTEIKNLLPALKLLHDDCTRLAAEPAIRFIQRSIQEDRDVVIALMAQQDILSRLLWALDGTAQQDGCEPTVDVGL